MKVLGIDPGIERLGWGLLKKTHGGFEYINSGVKKTLKSKNTSERLLEIYEFLNKLIQKEQPEMVGVEKLFFSKNVKTAMIIGEVRGVILVAAQKHGLNIKEFSPQEIKMIVCGHGNADKKEVASMLQLSMVLPNKKMLDDETDALAIALAATI